MRFALDRLVQIQRPKPLDLNGDSGCKWADETFSIHNPSRDRRVPRDDLRKQRRHQLHDSNDFDAKRLRRRPYLPSSPIRKLHGVHAPRHGSLQHPRHARALE